VEIEILVFMMELNSVRNRFLRRKDFTQRQIMVQTDEDVWNRIDMELWEILYDRIDMTVVGILQRNLHKQLLSFRGKKID